MKKIVERLKALIHSARLSWQASGRLCMLRIWAVFWRIVLTIAGLAFFVLMTIFAQYYFMDKTALLLKKLEWLLR